MKMLIYLMIVLCTASLGWSQTIEPNANSCLSVRGNMMHNSCQQTINVWYCVQNANSMWHCNDTVYSGGRIPILKNDSYPIQNYQKDGGGTVELFACYSGTPEKEGSGHICRRY